MRITRHFVDIGGRRVHYLRCGSGPALLMVHQSPRSSAEYTALMREWGSRFTCIAPDTPGFGQSDPLASDSPDIGDFADALLAFLDALGLSRVGAYGFHSGGIILMRALQVAPQRFSAVAIGGYALWTEREIALFSDRYLPPFRPAPYGEHLTWLWNRMLEQSWFFPWFATAPDYRLSVAHADIARVDAAVAEMLDVGDAYRAGYGAVLRAPRDIPADATGLPPVLVTAYDGDPLQDHIDRLGALPPHWNAAKLTTPTDHHAASLDFLVAHPAPSPERLVESDAAGFVHVRSHGFDGLLHWRGRERARMTVAGPGRAADLVETAAALDPPGHGLSDRWPGEAPTDPATWRAVLVAAALALGVERLDHEPVEAGEADALFPDLAPDRFGSHLTRAWAIVRARQLFAPWYRADAAHARDFAPEALAPERLAQHHRALMRASAARAFHIARSQKETDHVDS
jgi:haloalkane dehalogenase